VTKKLLKSKNL